MKDVSIIIISYNTLDMTLACIHSVYKQTRNISFEIIVVDNASSDGSANAIRQTFPDISLIALKKNIGFARANNLGAKKTVGQYILLLNPDTIVLNGAIQKLFYFAKYNPGNHIYGGRTLNSDLSLNPTSCWKKPGFWSLFCYAVGLSTLFKRSNLFDHEIYGNWQRDTIRTVDIVAGCFLLIDKNRWNKLKGFHPDFFMYGEDADLCLRSQRLGGKPIITPDAEIIHYCGASEKIKADKMVRLFRAKEQLIIRHFKKPVIAFGIVLLRTSVLLRSFAIDLVGLFYLLKKNTLPKYWKEIWRRRKEWQTF